MTDVILYLCDRKRCNNCNPNGECRHTTDICHSVNFKQPPEDVANDKRFVRTLYEDTDMRIFKEVEG